VSFTLRVIYPPLYGNRAAGPKNWARKSRVFVFRAQPGPEKQSRYR
jgi:hypothetical protein